MKYIIFLNGDRGFEVLKNFYNNKKNVVCVVSKKSFVAKLKEKISKKRSHFYSPESINSNESIKKLKSFDADVFIIAGFSQILKKRVIDIPRYGCINLHAGPLPKYRGGSPLNWQIINGEKQIGLSVILLDEGIDTGPILSDKQFKICETDNIETVHIKANKLFPVMVNEAIRKLTKGNNGIKQNEKLAQYWHQRNDDDGKINFSLKKANEVELFVRALGKPYPGAWCLCEESILRIFSCERTLTKFKGSPGKVIYIQGMGPIVICLDEGILLKHFEIKGKMNPKIKNGIYLK